MTLSGLIDAGYQSNDYKGQKVNGVANNGSATSTIQLSGTEDLGGGLKANFKLNSDFNPTTTKGNTGSGATTAADNTAASWLNSEQRVGLSGNFGEVQAGRVNTNALDSWGVGSVFGTALGSGYGSNGNIYTRYSASSTGATAATAMSAPTRFNGAVRYISPAFNGFSGSLLVVPKGASDNVQAVTDFGLKYANGPLNVMYANQEVKQYGAAATSFTTGTAAGLTTGTSNKLNILSANYVIGAGAVYGGYWTEKQNTATAVDARGYMLGGKYTMGATTLLASFGRNDDRTTANADKKIYGLGADYALSKRTSLYAVYGKAAQTAKSTTQTSFGVAHNF